MDLSTFAVRVMEMTNEEWEDGMSGNYPIPPVEDRLVPPDYRPSEQEECIAKWEQEPDYHHERAVWRCTRPNGNAGFWAIMSVVVMMIVVGAQNGQGNIV